MIKINLFSNWSLYRWIRLIIGIILTIYAFSAQQYFLLILSAIFIVQAILNFSSCNYREENSTKDD